MGKASNRSAKRRAARHRSVDAHEALWKADSLRTFGEVVSDYPEILASGYFDAPGPDNPAWAGFAKYLGETARLARTDLGVAWQHHAEHRARVESLLEQAGSILATDDLALADVPVLETLRQQAYDAGPGDLVWPLSVRLGSILISSYQEDRETLIERAGEALSDAMEVASDIPEFAEAAMLRGLAWQERQTGDPHQHRVAGVVDLRNAEGAMLGLASGAAWSAQEVELLATIRTNLAESLLRQADASVDDAVAAFAAARQADEARNPARDPNSWAYSRLALARASKRREQVGHPTGLDPVALLGEIFEHEAKILDGDLIATAHMLAGEWPMRSQWDTDLDYAQAVVENGGTEGLEPPLPAEQCLGHFRRALDVLGSESHASRARAWSGMAGCERYLGQSDAARASSRHAMEEALASGDAAALITSSSVAIATACDAEDWRAASSAYRVYLDLRFEVRRRRIAPRSRQADGEDLNRTHRWAAWAHSQVGEVSRAIEILDAGQAGELRRRLEARRVVEDPRQVWPDIDAATAATAAEQARLYLATPWSQENERGDFDYQDMLSEFEVGHGHPAWAAIPSLADIVVPALRRRPTLYVNPTPWGTQLIMLTCTEAGDPRFRAESIPLTSTDLTMALGVGPPPVSDALGLYLALADEELAPDAAAIAAETALAELLPWIAGHLAAPIQRLAEWAGTNEFAAITFGELTLVPLHALPDPKREGESLVDSFVVIQRPSTMGLALSGQLEPVLPEKSRFVGLALPAEDLEFAILEINEASRAVDWESASTFVGEAATVAELSAQVGSADVLHVACHAEGGLLLDGEPRLHLVNGFVSAGAFASLPMASVRLLVLSACESAAVTRSRPSAEAHSLAVAGLIAGAEAVLATTWPVDDWICGVLFAKFYRELAKNAGDPAKALAASQRWLRHAGLDEMEAFVQEFPAFRRQFNLSRQRAASVEGAEQLRAYWQRPYYWSPFVVVGR